MVGEFDFVSAYNASGVLTTVYTPIGKAEQVRGGDSSGGAGPQRVSGTRHRGIWAGGADGVELFCPRISLRAFALGWTLHYVLAAAAPL